MIGTETDSWLAPCQRMGQSPMVPNQTPRHCGDHIGRKEEEEEEEEEEEYQSTMLFSMLPAGVVT